MANTIVIDSTTIARMALETLYANTVMLPLVWKDFQDGFAKGQGDTVTIRKPATFTANTYNQSVGITKQNITEASTTLTLDTLLDVSAAVTTYEMTLQLVDFQRQVLSPMMEALAQGVDSTIITKMAAASWANTVTAAPFNASTYPNPTYDLIRAGRALDVAKVPMTNRQAVVDPYIYAQWKMDSLTLNAEKRADEGTALRDAEIGVIHGFDTFKSNNIAGSNSFKGWAFHPTAVAYASQPLELPKGAADAGSASYKGLTIRVVRDYDITYKSDVISIDILFGVKVLDTNRGVLINGNADS